MLNWYKLSTKELWYHGTLISNYSKISSQGLIANPTKRLWGKEDKASEGNSITPSQASFPGVYLTKDLRTAIDAPGDAIDKNGVVNESTSMLLVIVQADTQSLYIDEDAMSYEVSIIMESMSDYFTSYVYLAGYLKLDIDYHNRLKDRFVERQMKMLDKKFNIGHDELENRLKQILKDGWQGALTRQASYVEPKEWERAFKDLITQSERMYKTKITVPMPSIPQPSLGEDLFRSLMDQLTRTLKFSKHKQERNSPKNNWWDSGRYPDDIGFSGNTKVIAMVEVFLPVYKKFQYKLLYGNLPQQFLNDWKAIKSKEK